MRNPRNRGSRRSLEPAFVLDVTCPCFLDPCKHPWHSNGTSLWPSLHPVLAAAPGREQGWLLWLQQASGRGSHRQRHGPYRGSHHNRLCARPVPSSVPSEPLDGAEPRPDSPASIVLRFKSARSNRKASKRAEPANHAKGEPESAPREPVAARSPRRWRPARAPKSRHAASAFKEKRPRPRPRRRARCSCRPASKPPRRFRARARRRRAPARAA